MTRLAVLLTLLGLPVALANAGELRGSRASVRQQHEVARDQDLTFLRTAAQVRDFVAKERLELVWSTADLTMARVSFPYTRPIVKVFLERLAAQYRAATGEPLVVTSLMRPTSMQPRNASPLSVHPAGIAVDFRVPRTAAERAWLEKTLLGLENNGVLDVTRERRPPHYHVAVFPEQYETYLGGRIADEGSRAATRVAAPPTLAVPAEIAAGSVAATGSGQPIALIVAFAGIAVILGAGGLTLRQAERRRE